MSGIKKKLISDTLAGLLLIGLFFLGFACSGGDDREGSPAGDGPRPTLPNMANYSVGPRWFNVPTLLSSAVDDEKVSLTDITLQGDFDEASADITLEGSHLNVETGARFGRLSIQAMEAVEWKGGHLPEAGKFQVDWRENGVKNTVTVSVNPDVDGAGSAGVSISLGNHTNSYTWEQLDNLWYDPAAEQHERIVSFCYCVWREVHSRVMVAFQNLFDPPLPPWHEAQPYRLGTSSEDYARLGMTPGPPEVWEDGLRTDPNAYSFEWWYNDAHFEDGSSVVVVYFTKAPFTPGASITPSVSISITAPDGEKIEKSMQYDSADSFYSTEGCDIQIGPNYIQGDLATYIIYGQIDDVEINLTLKRKAPSWRPATGHLFFGEEGEDFFAWIPAVPSGIMSGSMTYNGETQQVIGSGYHDHNWGNSDVSEHLKYWWWTRAEVGPYTIIAVNQRIKNKYGNDQWAPVFVVLDENGALMDNALPDVTMTHIASNLQDHPDPDYCGEIAHTLTFHAEKDNGDWVEILFEARQLLASEDLLPLSGLSDVEIFYAKLLGKSPWYTRFASDATLTFDVGGVQYSGAGLSTVELMELE